MTATFPSTGDRAPALARRALTATMTDTAAKRLAADPNVAYVEPDRMAHQTNPANWGLDRIDQANLPLDKSYTAGSAASVHAYIIDIGIRMTHSEYAGRVTSGWDFVDNDANATDCQGHGTHVAGKTYGVAKDVRLVAVRVLLPDHRRRRLGHHKRDQTRGGEHVPRRRRRVDPG
jgi:subtilisin family serine protease